MPLQNIGVIGVGGVGGYFGAKLCQHMKSEPPYNTFFVARGEHLRAIHERGLRLQTEKEGEVTVQPTLATSDLGALPKLDLCLLCVKVFDLPAVLEALAPLIAEDSVILPLLNGVDIYDRIRGVIQRGVVLPACVYVGTHIAAPGLVVQRGGACKILFGPDPARREFNPEPLLALLKGAQINAAWMSNVEEDIWQKFIFICSYGLVSAANDKPVGWILENPEAREDTSAIMRELVALAKASGITLPEDVVERCLAKAQTFPYETKTSFQRDFEILNKRDERDLFLGTARRLSAGFDIPAPTIDRVGKMLEQVKPAVPPFGV
jgi:2-dehydropantoate 2-reductase